MKPKTNKIKLRKWHSYAARAGARKYDGKLWKSQIWARIWATNNKYAKCLGGE